MEKISKALHKIASELESSKHFSEAAKIHNLFLKLSNTDDIDHSDDTSADRDVDNFMDIARKTNYKVVVDFTTGQPVTHNGKILATFVSDHDFGEIKQRAKELTGIDTLAIKQMPIDDFHSLQFIDTYAGERSMDMLSEAFKAGIPIVPDHVYIMMLGENLYHFGDKLVVFASESDAFAFGEVIKEAAARIRGIDLEVSTAKLSLYISDSQEPGMSLPEFVEGDQFIWLSDSSFQITEIPETIIELQEELQHSLIAHLYTVDRLQREHQGEFHSSWDEDRLSSSLDKLHRIASKLEQSGMFNEAEILNDLFVRIAKKKSKTKKNVPNNPSLWAECKAWAKRTFDVYPCVPLDSMALTKDGWVEYSDLKIGDLILTYNQNIDKLEWKPILDLHFHEDAPTLSMKKAQTNFKIRCTPDHKWVLKTKNVKYPDNLVEAKNITKRMELKTAAEIVDYVNEDLDLSNWRKGDDWVKNVLSMSKSQLESFFASGIIYDGHDKGVSSLNRSTYGFSQKNTNHGQAMEIAAVLLGYRVSFVQKNNNPDMVAWTFIKRDSESTGNLVIAEDENCDVWCPETENHTWVMKQGRIITITGNSAYANGAASKRYKSKGGTWRKAK